MVIIAELKLLATDPLKDTSHCNPAGMIEFSRPEGGSGDER